MSIDGHKAMMSRDWARSIKRPLWAATGLYCLVFAHYGMAGDLPPAPRGMVAITDAQLFLELVVNQMNTGRVVAVERHCAKPV
jgi:outer membrane usher protein